MPYVRLGKPQRGPVEYSTVTTRAPVALIRRVQAYAAQHHLSVSDLIREGLEWRISQPSSEDVSRVVHEKTHEERPTAPGVSRVVQEETPQDATPPAGPSLDPQKHYLGKLCPRGHAWQDTGQSRRYLPADKKGGCVECDAEGARARRQQAKG